MGMARGHHPEFTRGGAIQQPRRQHTVIDDRELFNPHAFGIERLRAQAAHPQRIVDDADVAGK